MRARALLTALLLAIAPSLALAAPTPGPAPTPTPAPATGDVQIIPIPRAPEAPAPPQLPTIAPPPDLGPLAGKPVSRVVVVPEGNIWGSNVDIPTITSVKAQEPLTAAVARRALDEAMASGGFARGRVTVQPEGAGVLVVVGVVPRKLIGHLEVDLRGARVERDEMLRESELAEGGEVVGADVDEATGRIERYFALHGYPSAHVEITSRDTDDPKRVAIVITVTPGAARLVEDRRFFVFGAPDDQVRPLTGGYGVNPGDRADEPTIDAADAALEQTLHGRGWYHAAVSHDLVWVAPRGRTGKVVLRVRIDSGPFFVARFEGNEHYDATALEGALELDKETDRSPSHLADKIRAYYQKRGYLDAEVNPELRGGTAPGGGGEGGVQLVVLRIVEHRRVRVVSRTYPCLKLDAIRKLSGGGPRTPSAIGSEIDSFLEEDLPGSEILVAPDPNGVLGSSEVPRGALARPAELHPDATFVADTYERATAHVQELYRNEGFLHAQVGPIQIVRARCDPNSPPGRCAPVPLPKMPEEVCTYDAQGLPLAAEPLDPALTCRPDPAHGVECAPKVQLVIPIELGPRTTLWDVAFTGLKDKSEADVADAAQLALGEPVSTTKLDDARRRIVDWYKELGYFYVDVKYTLEPSLDDTRARVRFDVTEGQQVFVKDVVIHGLDATRPSIVEGRVALRPGQPYRTSDIRKTQERIATLGVFSSVTVSLEDPYVPGAKKVVDIDVVERAPQYVEVRPGFSTGEGMRGVLEYGHRNLFGYAIGVTFHVQASYLPDILILDPQVAQNFATLNTAQRLATRDTITFAFPDVGLGPTVRAQTDAVFVNDLERDFTLLKGAILGTMFWRPLGGRELQFSGGGSYEYNSVNLFKATSINQYLICINEQNSATDPNCAGIMIPQGAVGNLDLTRLLRVPDGDTNVVAGRLTATWDRRDSAFNAHRGTLVALTGEQVNSYPVQGASVQGKTVNASQQFEGHIVRLSQTFAAYLPLTSTVSFAAELRLGEVLNVSPCRAPFDTSGAPPPAYCTYPDRLFFMGGFDSMRGWLQDTFMPQELADQIASNQIVCTGSTNCAVPLRGGNLMINPRFELRFPVIAPIDGAVFTDFGNLWNDPNYIFQRQLTMRADVGAGVRVQTPVGPLVFDYGVNVTRRSYEDFGAFHFAIGLF
jgi:outer membrane protein insertion porin family